MSRTALPSFRRLFPVLAFCGLLPLSARAEDASTAKPDTPTQSERGTLLHPKVDKPIPQTYEPLGGTTWDEGAQHDREVRESWQLRRQQQAADEAAAARPVSDVRIQENLPGSPRPQGQGATPVEEDADSLHIRDAQ